MDLRRLRSRPRQVPAHPRRAVRRSSSSSRTRIPASRWRNAGVLLKIHGHVDHGGDARAPRASPSARTITSTTSPGVEAAAGTVPVPTRCPPPAQPPTLPRLRGRRLEPAGLPAPRVGPNDRLAYRSWAVQSSAESLARELWRERGVDAYDVALDGLLRASWARVTAELAALGRRRMSDGDSLPQGPYKGLRLLRRLRARRALLLRPRPRDSRSSRRT